MRVGAVISGTWSEEAQSVGVDDLGNAVGLDGFAEVEEVVPSRVGGDETAGLVEAGVVCRTAIITGNRWSLMSR